MLMLRSLRSVVVVVYDDVVVIKKVASSYPAFPKPCPLFPLSCRSQCKLGSKYIELQHFQCGLAAAHFCRPRRRLLCPG